MFPEYAADDGCERLWEFLLSPYNRMPTREVMLARAVDQARELKRRVELAKAESGERKAVDEVPS